MLTICKVDCFTHQRRTLVSFAITNSCPSLRGIEIVEVICSVWIATPSARNDEFVICNNGLLSLGNGLFSRNGYGEDFIFGFGNNFNYSFLFNRKINSKKNLFQGEER